MADNAGREGEEALFNIIRNPRGPDDDHNEQEDSSQYLNNIGEGDMIFDEDERRDEVQKYDDLQIRNTSEVYLYKQASGDHHMF